VLAAVTAGCAFLLAGCAASASPDGAVSEPAPTVAPIPTLTGKTASPRGSHPLGAKWDWSRVDRFEPYLRELSGGATFYELVWCDIERRRGEPDWSRADDVAHRSRQLGFVLHLKLRVGSCWATGGRGEHVRGSKQKTESLPPVDLAAYEGFVRAAVRRYAALGVSEYAVENEVNVPSMWGGTPEDLRRLVEVAGAAIRDEDDDALVVDPGISSTAYGVGIAHRLLSQNRDEEALRGYTSYYERRFSTRSEDLPRVRTVDELRVALAGEQARRNLSYLRLVSELAHSGAVDVRQLHFYERWTNVPAVVSFLRSEIPPGMPVEAWEVGRFFVDDDPSAPAGDGKTAGADELRRVVGSLLERGVRRVIWLPLAFDPGGRNPHEPRYGLLEPDGAVRVTGRVLLDVADRTRNKV
jgi:hypothetical protein